MKRARSFSDDDFSIAVSSSTSWSRVFSALNLKVGGSQYPALKKLALDLNLSTDHMKGQGWNKGTKGSTHPPKMPLHEILVEDSTFTNTNHLRLRLLREGVKQHRCELCGLSEWLGKKIPIELDHINGIRRDNRLENLRVLCPNCHATTDTYCGKNRKRIT